tara:strand:+ start:2629 stop:3099 length:471 start_codon:yes stop_codon:yes gene_type:complete
MRDLSMWHNFLKILSPENKKKELTGDEAIATILVRAAKTDNTYTKSEQNLIEKLLSKQIQVTMAEATKLRARGEDLEIEINDNFQLTRIIKNEIQYENRHELIQKLWQIIIDDDIRTPEENKFMRVLAHLLGVNDVQSAQARAKAMIIKDKNTTQT